MARLKRKSKLATPMPTSPLAGLLEAHMSALRVRDYSENTIRNQHMHVRYFLAWCPERGLTDPVEITRPILESYQRYLFYQRKRSGEPLSFRSQHARLVALRSWFRWLTRQNHILHNPASEIELPRLPRRLPRNVLHRAGGRAGDAAARHPRSHRPARPRHPGDAVLDRNAAHGADPSDALRSRSSNAA